MNRPLRTVIVGFGAIAEGLSRDARMARWFECATHAQVLSRHPAFAWEAVVDPAPAALERARRDWGIRHTARTVPELAATYDPEIAVLAMPPGERVAVLAALPGLRGCLIEKPLGAEGEPLLALCRSRRITTQVNFWRRGDAVFRELAAGRLAELVGRPAAVFATYGNGIANNGSHLVDFIRMLLGEISAVRGLAAPRPAAGAPLVGDVHLPFALTLGDGGIVQAAPLDFRHYREVGLDIWGETGRLAILQEGLGIQHFPRVANRGLEDAAEIASDRPETIAATAGAALYRLYDNLAAALDGAAAWSPLDSALRTQTILAAVLRSAAEGCRAVPLTE